MYSDDAKLLHDLLKDNWDTGLNNVPTITYTFDAMMVNARWGTIHIDRLTRSNTPDSTDYQTLTRASYLSVTVKNPANLRDIHFQWCEEVYRIFLENRRAGVERLDGWQTLEIISERPGQDLSGWYTTTFDIKLTRFHAPIRSHGFGSGVDICVPIPLEGSSVQYEDTCGTDKWEGGEEEPRGNDPCDQEFDWEGGEEEPTGTDPCEYATDLNSSVKDIL